MNHGNFFKTIKPDHGNDKTIINWQRLSGIKKNRRSLLQINDNNSTSRSNSRQIYTNQPHIPQSEVRNTPTNKPIATNNTNISSIKDGLGSYTTDDGLRRSVRLNAESSLIHDDYDKYYDAMHQEDYSIQNQMSNPISYAASTNKKQFIGMKR